MLCEPNYTYFVPEIEKENKVHICFMLMCVTEGSRLWRKKGLMRFYIVVVVIYLNQYSWMQGWISCNLILYWIFHGKCECNGDKSSINFVWIQANTDCEVSAVCDLISDYKTWWSQGDIVVKYQQSNNQMVWVAVQICRRR